MPLKQLQVVLTVLNDSNSETCLGTACTAATFEHKREN